MKLKFLFIIFCLNACTPKSDLTTVPRVDLEKYMGTWYEIARLPNRFQQGCTHTTATYTLDPDRGVEVLNRCLYKGNLQNEKVAKGSAYVQDTSTNSKLKVTFFWPFYGDYWIIDLADDYSYAIVASPDKAYLWILSRTPKISKSRYIDLIQKAKERGFDTTQLIKTYHDAPLDGRELDFITED